MTDFGEILRHIREFGLFQKLTLLALSFPNLVQAFIFESFLFVEFDPDRHCNTDWILSADPDLSPEEQLNLTLPREEDGTFSRCRMFKPVDGNISTIREHGLNEITGCQNGWVYINNMYDRTVVTDFNLVCDNANLVEVVQTVFMAGVLIGSLIFGPSAESYVNTMQTFFFPLSSAALSPNFYLYLAFQLIVGVGAGIFRPLSGFGAVGQCILAGLIYIMRDWRVTQLITAAPLTLTVVYIWFIPESARWLLNRGKTEEAKQLIMKAAAINKRTVPDYGHFLIMFHQIGLLLKQVGCSPLWSLERMQAVCICFRFTTTLVVYCLFFNMANLALSIFLTQFLFRAIEIPAHTLNMWLLEVFGRKKLLIATILFGGISCILILAVPQGKLQHI
uniref:Solute carrier family 22 member 13a n=1 Tax=Labrus bergylta TaxID=56723 RepID=A0A3Q3EAH3_9LABR